MSRRQATCFQSWSKTCALGLQNDLPPPTGCIVWFSFPSQTFKLGVRHPPQQLQMWCRNTARHDAGNDVFVDQGFIPWGA